MEAHILYHYSNITFEFTHQSEAVRDQFDERWIKPAFSTETKPLSKTEGFAVIFNEVTGTWSLLEDHRGQIFYLKETGQEIEIEKLGTIGEEVTDKSKPEGFYLFENGDWVVDKAALVLEAIQKRKNLAEEAEEKIKILERKVNAKRVTDAEKQLLDDLYNFTIDLEELDLSQELIEFPVFPQLKE